MGWLTDEIQVDIDRLEKETGRKFGVPVPPAPPAPAQIQASQETEAKKQAEAKQPGFIERAARGAFEPAQQLFTKGLPAAGRIIASGLLPRGFIERPPLEDYIDVAGAAGTLAFPAFTTAHGAVKEAVKPLIPEIPMVTPWGDFGLTTRNVGGEILGTGAGLLTSAPRALLNRIRAILKPTKSPVAPSAPAPSPPKPAPTAAYERPAAFDPLREQPPFPPPIRMGESVTRRPKGGAAYYTEAGTHQPMVERPDPFATIGKTEHPLGELGADFGGLGPQSAYQRWQRAWRRDPNAPAFDIAEFSGGIEPQETVAKLVEIGQRAKETASLAKVPVQGEATAKILEGLKARGTPIPPELEQNINLLWMQGKFQQVNEILASYLESIR